nr:hypothetical protein [Tanacetum cinerariifolium]
MSADVARSHGGDGGAVKRTIRSDQPKVMESNVEQMSTDDEDALPHDLAESDNEDLINVDDDDVDKVYFSEEED